MNTETIIEKFEEQEIAFDLFRGDLMVNATEMARPFRKRVRNWLRLDTTKALISAIKEDRKNEFKQLTSELFENEILQEKRGNHGGTFMCEDLALAFAMWLSPQFHVWVLKTVREIIFGNNPELVREAVMNMPRIQKELNTKRRKRNRIKAVLLGPDRRKEMRDLISKRSDINNRIHHLTFLPTVKSLQLDSESLGNQLIDLMNQRDQLEEDIKALENRFEKILVKEEYLDLVKEIRDLEAEQRQFSKIIRYSEFKFSQN